MPWPDDAPRVAREFRRLSFSYRHGCSHPIRSEPDRLSPHRWAYARRCSTGCSPAGTAARFILRIDDTDQERNVEAALRPILDGFRWLGIDWDEGPEVGGPCTPYYQSQRTDRYRAAVSTLLERGLAYRDYATAEETAAEREAAQREKRRFIYSRRWMAETDAAAARFEDEGRTAVVRLKMPREGACRFDDLVRGPVAFDWALEQDHVIQRADGSHLYHLASAVDDHDFGISHVIRAEEHLSNTPRQIFIADGLGYELPRYAHLPYVAAPGGSEKLSKRKLGKYLSQPEFKKVYDHGAGILAALGEEVVPERFNPVLVEFYRDVGYRPEALVNYLLLLGWSLDDRTEDFTREEMVEHFSLERVNRSAASFDPQKMMAFEERRMNALPLADTVAAVSPYLARLGLLPKVPTEAERARVGGGGSRRPATGSRWPATSCATPSSSRRIRRFPTTRRRSASGSARPRPRTGCGVSARCWIPSIPSPPRLWTPRCTGSSKRSRSGLARSSMPFGLR